MLRTLIRKYAVMLIAALTLVMLQLSCASAADFKEWLAGLRSEALAKGISEKTLDAALTGLEPIERVIQLDRNQPEFKKDYRSYMESTVTTTRILKGRFQLLNNGALLEDINKRFGVQPRFLVAIWGMETNFGSYLGNYSVIASLATLAFDERRGKFFRAELLNALKILDEGHISVSDMQGSWAGAMGQLQFMPSTFINFAVDGDNDGKKDIWKNLPDVFASAANYLSRNNWRADMTWGREVNLPSRFDQGLAGMGTEKTLSQWQALGIRLVGGAALPKADIKASLILPNGTDSPAFLVYQNYRAIYRWNRSHLYTLAVCTLADRLQ